MPEFVPNGYNLISEALDLLGRELFPLEWTGQEHKARRGLISIDEWLRIKDLPPPRGGGAGVEPNLRSRQANAGPSDPSDPLYQEEYRASRRYTDAQHRLRQMLETGQREAAILDPWTGKLHQASTSLWRRHNADRMIEKGQAPIPGSPNTGKLLVKQFAEANEADKPMPQAKIQEAIEALKQKIATESLTRARQKDFVRKRFPGHHVTERQFRQIFEAIAMPTGRPKKSDRET